MIFRNNQRSFIALSLITALSSISLEVNAEGEKDKTVLLIDSPGVGNDTFEKSLEPPIRVREVGNWKSSSAMETRLAPHDAKKGPLYGTVVADARFPSEGKFIEKGGSKALFEDTHQFHMGLTGDKKIEISEKETGGTILWNTATGKMEGNSLLITGAVLRQIPTKNLKNLKMVVDVHSNFKELLTHNDIPFIVNADDSLRVSVEGTGCFGLLAALQGAGNYQGALSGIQVSVTAPDEELRRRVGEALKNPELKMDLVRRRFLYDALDGKTADEISDFFNKIEGPSSGIPSFENEKRISAKADEPVFFDDDKRMIYTENRERFEEIDKRLSVPMDDTVPEVVIVSGQVDLLRSLELAKNLLITTSAGANVFNLPKEIEERDIVLSHLEAQNVPVIYGMAVPDPLQLETVTTHFTIGPDPFLKLLLSPSGVLPDQMNAPDMMSGYVPQTDTSK